MVFIAPCIDLTKTMSKITFHTLSLNRTVDPLKYDLQKKHPVVCSIYVRENDFDFPPMTENMNRMNIVKLSYCGRYDPDVCDDLLRKLSKNTEIRYLELKVSSGTFCRMCRILTIFSRVGSVHLLVRNRGVLTSTIKKTTVAVVRLLRHFPLLTDLKLENLDPFSAFDDNLYTEIARLNLRLESLWIETRHWQSSSLDVLISSVSDSLKCICLKLLHGNWAYQDVIASVTNVITTSVCELKCMTKVSFEVGRLNGDLLAVEQYSKRVLRSIYDKSRDTILLVGVDVFPPEELDLFSDLIRTRLIALSAYSVDLPKLRSVVEGSKSLKSILVYFKPGEIEKKDVKWLYQSIPFLSNVSLFSSVTRDDPVVKYANRQREFMQTFYKKVIMILYPRYFTNISRLGLLSVDILRRIICDYLYNN